MIDASQEQAEQAGGPASEAAAAPVAQRWVSVSQAAMELGVPERVVYRRVATQALRARRAEDGSLLICPDGPVGPETAVDPVPRDTGVAAVVAEPTRALVELAQSLVTPLVGRLAEQEETIRLQAEELGRLRAQVEAANAARARLAPLLDTQARELTTLRTQVERLVAARRRWWPF